MLNTYIKNEHINRRFVWMANNASRCSFRIFFVAADSVVNDNRRSCGLCDRGCGSFVCERKEERRVEGTE